MSRLGVNGGNSVPIPNTDASIASCEDTIVIDSPQLISGTESSSFDPESQEQVSSQSAEPEAEVEAEPAIY